MMPMYNNTPEDYKKAVRDKYEIEKSGRHFIYLNNPTRAKLRDLCWEIFEGNKMHQDDLNVFNSLLEVPFDLNKKNKFREQIDKFRPIETFYKGETDLTNIDAVNLAAILVDYQPRPFNKFRGANIEEEIRNEKLKEVSIPESNNIKDKTEQTIPEKVNSPQITTINTNIKSPRTLIDKLKLIAISVVVVFGLGFLISRYVFPKQQCMQWSNDHYEKVDCDLKVNGLTYSTIEPFDELKFELKRINVCDTTTCFKNGKPIIWYAKTSSGADFFNTHGIHPENDKALRPVTEYIRGKYKKPCKSK
ncbi:hypothetical protein [Flavobacterium sp. 1355]|uniref:hypothetical protein n=1 Tax=Flavobacterium sp. 1355 TaxID=2806571 RepID=UPI001AEB05BF|nr:hypothetical protein [Flavobacterium sp. 1355]